MTRDDHDMIAAAAAAAVSAAIHRPIVLWPRHCRCGAALWSSNCDESVLLHNVDSRSAKKQQQDSALYAGKISGSDRIREVVDVTGTLK